MVLAQWRLRPTVPPGSPMRLYRPVGCPKCRDSGYHGRVGLYELMEATATIRRLIQARSTVQLLFEQAARDGMLRLRQYGIETVLSGDCDLRSVRGACA